MIEIKYNPGRLGNQMFTHFYACTMSIEEKCQIENPPDSCICVYDNQPQKYNHLNFSTSPIEYYQTPEVIEKFTRYKKHLFFDVPEKDGLFVHFRLGARPREEHKFLVAGGRVPGIEYYRKQLKTVDTSNGYIASDWSDHNWVKELSNEFGLKIYRDEPEQTIIFGSSFKNKVLSLGTFSWWIGFLGSQNNVICPDANNYPRWHGPIFDCMDDWKKSMKKIISFSLYGNKPNFQVGAVVNVLEAKRLYPDWKCRFYTTDDDTICKQLEYLGAEIVRMDDWPEGQAFWRFLAVGDSDVCNLQRC